MTPLRPIALALALLAGPCPRALQAAEAAERGDLLRAVNRSPSLDAAWKRIQAARARTEASGRLANPEAEVMASRVNAPVSTENRDLWELTVRQPLPRRGERAADRERAQAVVTLAEADYAMTAGDLAADLAASLAEAEGADERARLLDAQRARLQAALQSLEARLATGVPARLSDRLSLQTRAANLQLATEQARRTADDARLAARSRLGLDPSDPLPAFAAPAPADINPEDATTLAVARARLAEANAMGRMARAGANPMTSVGLRFERERGGMGRQETVGLALSSEIPWRSGRYSRAEARAAEAERAAAQSEATALMGAHPNLKLLMNICSPAVPGAAEAVKQAGKAGKVKVIGLGLPNENRRYVKEGVTDSVILWKTEDLGALTVEAAVALAKGTLKKGDTSFRSTAVGAVEIKGDSILLGKPFVFNRDNIDQFNF